MRLSWVGRDGTDLGKLFQRQPQSPSGVCGSEPAKFRWGRVCSQKSWLASPGAQACVCLAEKTCALVFLGALRPPRATTELGSGIAAPSATPVP